MLEALTQPDTQVIDFSIGGQPLRCLTATVGQDATVAELPAGFVPAEYRRISVAGCSSRVALRTDMLVYLRPADYNVLVIRPGRITWYQTYGELEVYLWLCDRIAQQSARFRT